MQLSYIPHSKPWITPSDIQFVSKQLQNGMIANGEKVKEFEFLLAQYLGVSGAAVTSSGVNALILCLQVLDIGKGDEVILPSNVCQSVLNAVYQVGATPVLCDTGTHWIVTVNEVEKKITSRTKAIIAVHILGVLIDVSGFLKFNIPIIEDCCQSFGGKIGGRNVGTVGSFGIFSFQATKCLTTGEGGAVISKSPQLMQKIEKSNQVGASMSDMQAALGISQLSRYDEMLKLRREIAERYFRDFPDSITFSLKQVNSMFFRFPLLVKQDFETIRQEFEREKIAVRKGVDTLLHRKLHYSDKMFPNTSFLFEETISLPIYPDLKEKQISRIIRIVKQLLKKII
jgi:perosamine synthetase